MKKILLIFAFLLLAIPSAFAQTNVFFDSSTAFSGQEIIITVSPAADGVLPETYIEKEGMKIIQLNPLCSEIKCLSESKINFKILDDYSGIYYFVYTDVSSGIQKKEFNVVNLGGGQITPNLSDIINAMNETPVAAEAGAEGEQEGKRYVKTACSFAAKSNIIEEKPMNDFKLVHSCPNCPTNYDLDSCNEKRTLLNGIEERRSFCVKRDAFGGIYDSKYSSWESRSAEEWECGSKCQYGWKWAGRCEGKDHALGGLVPLVVINAFTLKSEANLMTFSWLSDIWDKGTKVVNDVGKGIAEIGGGIVEAVKDVGNGIGEAWEDVKKGNILKGVGDILDGVATGIGSIGEGAVKGSGDILGGLTSIISPDIGDKVSDAFDDAGDGIKNLFGDLIIQGDERQQKRPVCYSATEYQNSFIGQGTKEAFGYTECALTPMNSEGPSCGGDGEMAGEKIGEYVCYWQLEKSGDYAILYMGETAKAPNKNLQLVSADSGTRDSDKITLENANNDKEKFVFETGKIDSLYSQSNVYDCSILRKTKDVVKNINGHNIIVTGYYTAHCTSSNIEFAYAKIKYE